MNQSNAKPSGTSPAAGSPRGNHAHTITGKVRNASAPWSGDSPLNLTEFWVG